MDQDARFVDHEERFKSLFENNPDLILFQNRAGIILDANPAFLAVVHKQKEEVLNRLFSEFQPPEKVDLFNEKLAEAFRGTPVEFDVEVQLKGADRPMVLTVAKVPLWVDGKVVGVHMVARDITEVAAAQDVVRDQAQTLNTIFESITDAFLLLDRNWKVAYVNSEVERLLGMSREELLGKNIWKVFMGEVVGTFRQMFRQAMDTGNTVDFEAFFEPRQLWLDVKAYPSEKGLSVYFSDVTDKVKAHQELYRQNQDLQQFAYVVSHNLRAPLTNMLGLVELLTSVGKQEPQYDDLLQHLRRSTEQLDTVMRDMSTILTIRDQQDVALAEQVPLAEVVGQVLQNLQEVLQQCGAEVKLEVPAELRVRGNRAYLYSIFFNLVSNAIKYRSAERPLLLEIRATKGKPASDAEITVKDNGIGFDLERAGTDVFKLYKRFHSQPAGRGLGLYLVKNHVDAMKGRIGVQSEVNAGTQFTLYLS
jgi:PAS domain S-box-containing protein